MSDFNDNPAASVAEPDFLKDPGVKALIENAARGIRAEAGESRPSDTNAAPVKVMLGFPCHGDPKRGFMIDYMNLLANSARPRPSGREVHIHCGNTVDSILPRGRQGLVQYAFEKGCTHLLTLDADMRFPPDTVFRLVDHGLPIVGANYVSRRNPYPPTACKGGRMITSKGKTGVETGFDYFGLGACLIDLDVFRAMSKEWPDLPYFQFGWSTSERGWIGEDVYMMRRARALGYDLAIDHDLSNDVRHIGDMEFSFAIVDHDEADMDPRKIAGTIDEVPPGWNTDKPGEGAPQMAAE